MGTLVTVFYGPDLREVGRAIHQIGDLVDIHKDAESCRTFGIATTLPPPPSEADAQVSAGAR